MRIDLSRFGITSVALFATFGLFASVARAADKPAQKVKVFVFVQTDASGFVDQRTTDLQASLKDLREAVTKKPDWLQLVEAREQADVVLELTERTLVERAGALE